jgi:hypothetical protein
VDLHENIEMDDPTQIPKLVAYGEQMGQMILNDQLDGAQGVVAEKARPA